MEKRRMNNFFRANGKSFMLALDHAISFDVYPDMKDTGSVIEKAVSGGIDGILTTYGIAEHFKKAIGNVGLMMRIDGGYTEVAKSETPTTNMYTVEDAVRIGADGVLCMGFVGTTDEAETLQGLADNVAEARKFGLVVGAEMLPGGINPKGNEQTPKNINYACRIGAELGADLVKTVYSGDINSFRHIVDNCYRPILILGGSDAKTERDLLTLIKNSLDSGAKGVIMGRNIWKHKNIKGLCLAISNIIHEDMEIEKALKYLN